MNLLLNQTPDILALRETNLDDSIDSIDSLSVLLLFPLSITFFVFVHGFDSISSDINEVLSINPSNVLSLETLTPLIRTDLSILVELIGLVNSIIIFLSQMTLLIWLTFLLRSQTDTHSPALLDLFLSSDASLCSTLAFPPLGNCDHVVVSVSI